MTADWYPGIKAFGAHWSHAPMLQQTLTTLEREFADDSDACIDAAKGFVECACRVIIDELDDPLNPLKPAGTEAPIGKLVAAATRLLKLADVRHREFADLIKHHNNMTDSLRRLRNESGTVSHGKDGFIAKLSAHHRRSSVLAADAIVTFLHAAYLERDPDPVLTQEPYERFAESNALIDRFVTIQAETDEEGVLTATILLPEGDDITLVVEPSRLLFGIDRQAYKLALNACREAVVAKAVAPEPEEAVA